MVVTQPLFLLLTTVCVFGIAAAGDRIENSIGIHIHVCFDGENPDENLGKRTLTS
jgi:hypothetical protein